MGEAIITAILKKKLFRPSEIGISEPDRARLNRIKRKFKIVSFSSNTELTRSSHNILLAVKPQQMLQVLEEIRMSISSSHLILSIAAGLDTNYFEKKLPGVRIIRIMPNMGMMVGEGASALYATPRTSRKDKMLALKVFSAGGYAVSVDDEELLDVVTALSGSGPAFTFAFMEDMIRAAEKLRLPAEMGSRLMFQTVLGAAKLSQASREPLSSLISKVASKGGTTEAGLSTMTRLGFEDLIEETLKAAAQKAKELRCTS